jgi:thioredoxin 1
MELNNSGDFEMEVAEGTVLVDFYGPGCAPCRALGMLLDQIDKDEDGIKILKVDISKHAEIGSKFDIAAVPTVHMYVDGKRVDGFCGLRPKSQIMNMVNGQIAE